MRHRDRPRQGQGDTDSETEIETDTDRQTKDRDSERGLENEHGKFVLSSFAFIITARACDKECARDSERQRQ